MYWFVRILLLVESKVKIIRMILGFYKSFFVFDAYNDERTKKPRYIIFDLINFGLIK